MLRSHSFCIDAIVMSFIVFILYVLCAVTLNVTASEYTINSQNPTTLVLHTICVLEVCHANTDFFLFDERSLYKPPSAI